jgi:predicted ATPase/class 3 adenylate cyclase/DNA-binding CsgD family transcriptional regulator/Tfp pilus assembly protein PilF
MAPLPTGTVTCLLTDVEGSTRLRERFPDQMRAAIARHDALFEELITRCEGIVVRPRGDGDRRLAVFPRAPDAIVTAAAIQKALHQEPWPPETAVRVRMALHTGEVDLHAGDYYGTTVNRCARLRAIAHGGQVLVSQTTADLVRDALPVGIGLQDLGEQRPRDLAQPERVYQIVAPGLAGAFPLPRSLDRSPHNLPIQATPFIGREQQIEILCTRILGPDVRLLTLTGPGGTGKTRLALQAAAELLDNFADGVFVVSLAPLGHPDLVPSAIAQALEVKETGGRPIVAVLKNFLRAKRLLLVLDNFEHLLDAALVVTELLGAAPRMKVLVTSRAVLHLYGEHEFPVPPLALPDHRAGSSAAHVAQFEAVRLFAERAQAARPDFAIADANAAAVAELCRRLDGLPLALELAAARLRALPLPALLARLERRLPLLTGGPRDLPARQQTLRNTIAWSYDLLGSDEQALFRRLSVFRGCTLEAAEAVCVAPADQPRSTSIALPPLGIDVLEGLTSLVEKSLVRQEETEDGQPWYAMLETVREFAAECLAESGEAPAVQRRHILCYLRLAETADPALLGPQQKQWFARLSREHDNLRAALDWCCAHGYAEPAHRLAIALHWFWSVRGHAREGGERLAGLLDRFPLKAPAGPRADLRARVLFAASDFAFVQADYAASRRHAEERLAIYQAMGDTGGMSSARQQLSAVAYRQGDFAMAQRHLHEALAIIRTGGDPYLAATLLNDLANVLHEQGDYGAARERSEEALTLLSKVGNPRELASASLTRAIIAQDEGDHDTAQRLLDHALFLFEREGDSRQIALALANLGSLAAARGDFAAAHQRLSASLSIQRDLADMDGTAFVLDRFAALTAAQGRPARALRLAGAAAALRTVTDMPLSAAGQARLDGKLTPAWHALGEAAAAQARRDGAALSPEEAVAEALRGAESAAETRGGAGAGQADSAPAAGLTARQREVACLIAQARTNRQIAEALVITEGTAANHVVHILNKLGFNSRIQIAAWAVSHGLTGGQAAAGA